MHAPGTSPTGVETATRHALGWLVFGNSVGLFLAILLVEPQWQLGDLSYGRWVPLHLNSQLYGWTALPLVAWLLQLYEVDASKFRSWGPAAVWAWTAALSFACLLWLKGESSGKIFLDWRAGSLQAFVVALVILWAVLFASWWDRASEWSRMRVRVALAGLVVLAMVPLMMVMASSPKTYPPVDPTTGGPLGSSLMGSTLLVVVLMLMLPRTTGIKGRGTAISGTWWFFVFALVVFGLAEAKGGGHYDWWQIGAMLIELPWIGLIIYDWAGFQWPECARVWRKPVLFWWTLLSLTAVGMYFPGILDHIKFTQGLVAHSHLAMAAFTTSFCALILSVITGRSIGSARTVRGWNLTVFIMLMTLATLGWCEGQNAEWMIVPATWRQAGMFIRAVCGAYMLAASASWLIKHRINS